MSSSLLLRSQFPPVISVLAHHSAFPLPSALATVPASSLTALRLVAVLPCLSTSAQPAFLFVISP